MLFQIEKPEKLVIKFVWPKLLVLEVAEEKPVIYLREIKQVLMEETGTEVDISTICRFLKESSFTRQDGDHCQAKK
jgi:transposase